MGTGEVKSRTKTVSIRRKTQKKTIKNQKAGSFFGTSFNKKIIEYLLKLSVISKDQSKVILSFANNGDKKRDKIELFVDKTLEIILENLNNIWKKHLLR